MDEHGARTGPTGMPPGSAGWPPGPTPGGAGWPAAPPVVGPPPDRPTSTHPGQVHPARDVAVEADQEPARGWVEALAALLVGVSVVVIAQNVLTAVALHQEIGPFASSDRWDIILPVAAQGGSLLNALVLAVALGLVLVAPGPVGPWGRAALTGVSTVGVVVAALAVLGLVEVLTPRGDGAPMLTGSFSDRTALVRVTEVLRWVPGLVVAGPAAWMAWRNLNPARPPAGPTAPPDPYGADEVLIGRHG